MASRTERRRIMLGAGAIVALSCAGLTAAPSGCFLDPAGLGTGGSSGHTTVGSTSGTGGQATSTTSGTGGQTTSTTSGTGGQTTSTTSGTGGQTSSTGGQTTSTTSSTGTGGGCTTAAQCPGAGPCATATCTNHVCGLTMTPAGMPCAGQAGVCDTSGSCVTCIATPVQAGCTAGEYCYADACWSCTDKKQDGDESDVDCGGSCPKCTPGSTCKADGDCASGHCAGGLCCDAACTDACQSCSLPGLVGTCTNIPWGETSAACGASSYCRGDKCAPLGGLMSLGSPCTVSNYQSCVNGYCGGGACKLRPGDPCTRDIECGNSLCSQSVCKACTQGSDCASGQCYTAFGLCKQAEGSFCDADYECVGGKCNNGVCSLQLTNGQSCTASADCSSWLCQSGVCAACTSSNCASCNAGACLAPSGTPCRADSACDSGKCVGTPPYLTCM